MGKPTWEMLQLEVQDGFVNAIVRTDKLFTSVASSLTIYVDVAADLTRRGWQIEPHTMPAPLRAQLNNHCAEGLRASLNAHLRNKWDKENPAWTQS